MISLTNRHPQATSRKTNTNLTTRSLPLSRHLHRERDFGVGYGNSSGYASDRHYAPTGATAFFRCY